MPFPENCRSSSKAPISTDLPSIAGSAIPLLITTQRGQALGEAVAKYSYFRKSLTLLP